MVPALTADVANRDRTALHHIGDVGKGLLVHGRALLFPGGRKEAVLRSVGTGQSRSSMGEAWALCHWQITYADAGVALKNKPKMTEVVITFFTSQLHVRFTPLKRQRRFLG